MKLFKFSTVAGLAMVMLVAVSCGKDKKSNNNPAVCDIFNYSSCVGMNPYMPGGVGPGGLTFDKSALPQLQTWYGQVDQMALPSLAGLIDIVNGFQVGYSSEYCYRMFGGYQQIGTYNKVSGQNYCSNMQNYSKSVNAKLAEILGPNSQYRILQVSVTGSRYYVTFGPNINGYPDTAITPSGTYLIDVAQHSMFNPTVIYGANGSVKEYVQIKPDNSLKFY